MRLLRLIARIVICISGAAIMAIVTTAGVAGIFDRELLSLGVVVHVIGSVVLIGYFFLLWWGTGAILHSDEPGSN